MLRILLTGAGGQVGWELRRSLSTLGTLLATDRSQLDLSNFDRLRQVVREFRPSLVVNTAAYTAVDRAESEAELALRINGEAPGVLAEEAKRLGTALVHYSTDYVFDGSSPVPYTEDDAPSPLNTYGRSKLAGDQAVCAVDGAHLVLRTSWVYAARGRNFVLTMLKLGRERAELRVVDDQIGAPTSSRVLADATAQIISQMLVRAPGNIAGAVQEHRGVYNLTCSGDVTWCGFARRIFQMSSLSPRPLVTAIPTSQYPTPAKRPRYSLLSGKKLQDAFALQLPSWQEALARVMEELSGVS